MKLDILDMDFSPIKFKALNVWELGKMINLQSY